MTSNRDPDRIVRAWLDLMPDEAPDRTVADVLQAVEGAPQLRRRPRLVSWRLPQMNRYLFAAAITAVVVAAIGGVLIGGGSSPASVGQPPTSPVTTPSPSALIESPSAIAVAPSQAMQGHDGSRLEPGTYATTNIDLRLNPDEISKWNGAPDALTFTVPDGWTEGADNESRLWLMRTEDFNKVQSGGGDYSIYVFARPAAVLQGPDCPSGLEPGVGRSPDQLVNWIRSVPGVHATKPADITVDGHPGRWIDVRLATNWTKTCPWTGDPPAVDLMTEAVADSNWGKFGVVGEQQLRMIFVDLGQGDTVLILIASEDPARFADLVRMSLPIIASFHFK
jgi:hypothetical protein